VELGAAVTGVTTTDNGVEVTYTSHGRDRRIRADYCVAAMPPYLLALFVACRCESGPGPVGAQAAARDARQTDGAFRDLPGGSPTSLAARRAFGRTALPRSQWQRAVRGLTGRRPRP
jgi:hypothetical protein